MSTIPPGISPQATANAGKPVTGNTGVANPNNTAMSHGSNPFGVPGNYSSSGAVPFSSVGSSSGVVTPGNTMPSGMQPLMETSGAVPSTIGGTTGATGSASGALNNQLTDIYGQGVGNLLGSEIGNLGSDNSAYLQAYRNSMAPQNAEDLASLQTTMGNEGVGANSSTAAIAQADLQSQINARENMAGQQLTMQDIQNLMGLTQGMQGQASQEVSNNWWGQYIMPLMQMGTKLGTAALTGKG